MNWFSHNHDQISESDLIAYHLHELPPRRERQIARALQDSAALAAESTAVETTLRTLKDTPQPIQQAAFTRTWAALEPALVPYAIPAPSSPRWRTPVLALTAAGIIAVGAALFATSHHELTRHSDIAGPATGTTATPTQQSQAHPPNGDGHALEPSFPTNSAPLAHLHQVPRIPQAPLTDAFQGRVNAGVYHPAQPGQAPPVHPLALSPVPPAPPFTPAEQLQPQPGLSANTLPSPPLTPLPSPPPISQTSTAQGLRFGKNKQRRPRTPHATDLMFALGGTFITPYSSLNASNETRTQTVTHAIAAIAAFHQQFRPALGYRLTLSYTEPDFHYIGRSTRIFEAAGTYVIQGPHHGRLTTSADAGAALAAFLPNENPDVSYVYRAAGVLAASAEYSVAKHWSARATYRVQVFPGFDFRYTGGPVPVATSVIVSNEPSVGIVYHFGKNDARAPKP